MSNSMQVFMELDTLVAEGYADELTPVEEHGGHLLVLVWISLTLSG